MSKFVQVCVLVMVGMLVCAGSRAHAAFDMFIQFSNEGTSAQKIEGDSKAEGLPSGTWSEIKNISFGIENIVNIGSKSGGAGAGKATFKEIALELNPGQMTNALFLTCALGGHYEKVTIGFRKSGAATGKAGGFFMMIELSMVAVKTVDFSGSQGDDNPSAKVAFECGAIKMTVYKQSKDGSLDTKSPNIVSWDKTTNSAGK